MQPRLSQPSRWRPLSGAPPNDPSPRRSRRRWDGQAADSWRRVSAPPSTTSSSVTLGRAPTSPPPTTSTAVARAVSSRAPRPSSPQGTSGRTSTSRSLGAQSPSGITGVSTGPAPPTSAGLISGRGVQLRRGGPPGWPPVPSHAFSQAPPSTPATRGWNAVSTRSWPGGASGGMLSRRATRRAAPPRPPTRPLRTHRMTSTHAPRRQKNHENMHCPTTLRHWSHYLPRFHQKKRDSLEEEEGVATVSRRRDSYYRSAHARFFREPVVKEVLLRHRLA